MKIKSKIVVLSLMVVSLCGLVTFGRLPVLAAQTITVNSNGDAQADDGVCTLREAIIAANINTASGATLGECIAGDIGTDTINFNITGTADFTNGGQNGYTISPATAFPDINEAVIIDGYSQPGSAANTAVAPAALNGIILIELDGSALGGIVDGLSVQTNNVQIRGLAINDFTGQGIGIGGDNTVIQGNYLGTDPTGLIAEGNELNGVAHIAGGGTDALIGGLDPEDRNLISGNDGGGSSPNTDSHNWTYYGNYIGVDATGIAALPNAQPAGSGGLSLDNSNGHIVGGSQTGAINVIAGNNSHGIAPHNADNVVIEGNFIGVGADGVTVLGNGFSGVTFSDSESASVINNLVYDSAVTGIFLGNTNNSTVSGNTIDTTGQHGVLVQSGSGNTIEDNSISDVTDDGIFITLAGSGNNVIGNTVANSGDDGIGHQESGESLIAANSIDGSTSFGIYIISNTEPVAIGGSTSSEANVITDTAFDGIEISAANEVSVTNNEVDGTGQSGISGINSSNVDISSNVIINSTGNGIDLADIDFAQVESNSVGVSGGYGIRSSSSVNLFMSLNEVSQSTQDGIDVQTTDGVIIDANIVADNDSEGIIVDGASTGLELTNNTSDSNGSYGISVAAGQTGALISGNTVTNAASQGGIIGNGIEDSIIDSNIVEDNEFVGIVITSGSTGNVISNNQVARNLGTGVNIAGGSTNNQVVGNEIFDNSSGGINIDNSNDNVIGGSIASDQNVIFGHASSNINISGFGGVSNGNVVQGNFVGVSANGQLDSGISQSSGISISGSAQYNLIGGTGIGEGNRIVGNTVSGIQSTAITIGGFGSFTPSSNTFIGNSVYGNEAGSINGFDALGLGIELLNINVDGGFVPQSTDSDGPDVNDVSDSDTGTNNYMNYPVVNSASQNLLELDVNFDLDAADSPTDQYRVEFFANDSADDSGYGEGQTYLGSTTVSPGSDQVANLTLPAGTNLTGKVLSATTTAIDNTTTSGFGSTSEFSLVNNIDIIALPQEPEGAEGVLANTGQNITALLAIPAALWGFSLALIRRQHPSYSLNK